MSDAARQVTDDCERLRALEAQVDALTRQNAILSTDNDLLVEKAKQAFRSEQAAKNKLNATRAKDADADNINAVADHWRVTLNHPRAKVPPGSDRWEAIRKMSEHFTPAELKQAVNGCARFPYVVNAKRSPSGTRKQRYDDLTLICRDVRHVERFMDLALDDDGEPVEPVANEPVVSARLLDEAVEECVALRRALDILRDFTVMQDAWVARLEAEIGIEVAA